MPRGFHLINRWPRDSLIDAHHGRSLLISRPTIELSAYASYGNPRGWRFYLQIIKKDPCFMTQVYRSTAVAGKPAGRIITRVNHQPGLDGFIQLLRIRSRLETGGLTGNVTNEFRMHHFRRRKLC